MQAPYDLPTDKVSLVPGSGRSCCCRSSTSRRRRAEWHHLSVAAVDTGLSILRSVRIGAVMLIIVAPQLPTSSG